VNVQTAKLQGSRCKVNGISFENAIGEEEQWIGEDFRSEDYGHYECYKVKFNSLRNYALSDMFVLCGAR
jgi:hypothetical protein